MYFFKMLLKLFTVYNESLFILQVIRYYIVIGSLIRSLIVYRHTHKLINFTKKNMC